VPAAGQAQAWFGPKERAILLDPVLLNNPIGVQVLGICSALAVTTSVAKALVMSAGLTWSRRWPTWR
jgi:Na+-transporting NADH:ubiquinone oxidoreductase subunit NqrD